VVLNRQLLNALCISSGTVRAKSLSSSSSLAVFLGSIFLDIFASPNIYEEFDKNP